MEQSDKASDEIKKILHTIQEDSSSSVSQIEIGKPATTISVARAESSMASLRNMTATVAEMISLINQLNQSMNHIETRSNQISSEMTNISAVTQESVASVESLSGLSENQMSATRKVNDDLIHLKNLAHLLQKKFSGSM